MKQRGRRRDLLFGHAAYWGCQVLGWGGYMAVGIVSDALWERWTADTVTGTLVIGGSGLMVSHVYRAGLKWRGWMERPLGTLPTRALLGTGIMSALWLGLTWAAMRLSGALDTGELTPWRWAMICLYALLLSGGWNAIYFAYHAGRRLLSEQRQAQVDRWRLQAALAEAQFQALKAQVHPHFLFNALNSLRALVDEDPPKAREAVTRLSNLLRYSLQAGARATVNLGQELEVVDDYLGLEAVRFEGRLRVRRSVDPTALTRSVPPLSVQTLVENAVKYGVSPFRQPEEITLTISVDKPGGALRVEVANGITSETRDPASTGDGGGLGLINLRERLGRLFGPGATLRLDRAASGRVTATMTIPAAAPGPAHPPPVPPVPFRGEEMSARVALPT